MQSLRSAHRFTRLVLAWFVLAMGVAVASPLVNPQSTALVCSVGGVMKLLPSGGDGDASTLGSGLLDCPLCLQLAAPPAIRPDPGGSLQALSGLVPWPESRPAIRSAAPRPGRGPPAFA